MRQLIGLIGLCLAGFAIAFYTSDAKTGACVVLAIAGVGMVADSLRK